MESSLVSPEGGLQLATLTRLSSSDENFGRTIDRLREENYGDPEAVEIARIFQDRIDAVFAESGSGVSLTRLACGLSVCAAELNGRSMAKLDFINVLMNAGDGRAKIHASDVRIIPPQTETSVTRYRVFFSTDPAAGVLVVPPGPTP